jgi:hypothetical protein
MSSSNNDEQKPYQKKSVLGDTAESDSSTEAPTVRGKNSSQKGKGHFSTRSATLKNEPGSFNHSIKEAGKRILGDFFVESDSTSPSQPSRSEESSQTTNGSIDIAKIQEHRSGPTATRQSKKHEKARPMAQLLESLSIPAATQGLALSEMKINQTNDPSVSTGENDDKTQEGRDIHIFEADDEDSGTSTSPWLIEETKKILGPPSKIADTESLIGKPPLSFQAKPKRGRKNGSETSFDSGSRFSTHQISSVMSAVSSSMSADILEQTGGEISFKTSKESLRSDKKRLEAQLAHIAALENDLATTTSSITLTTIPGASLSTISNKGKSNVKRRKKIVVLAPPGKLGVILSNRYDYSCALALHLFHVVMRLTFCRFRSLDMMGRARL